MKNRINFFQLTSILLVVFLLASCQTENEIAGEISIVPIPKNIEKGDGFFILDKNTHLNFSLEDEALDKLASKAIEQISIQTKLDIHSHKDGTSDHGINLILSEGFPSEEAYRLEITPEKIDITASSPAGVFYGLQSLYQIIPWISEEEGVNNRFSLPAAIIEDSPEYAYRGSMLDVARHFFDVATVKQYIDYITELKMNQFHIHLTDDQGWRIEIKSWPKLTEVGGSTEVGGGEGGFFTQKEYKEIVEYAAERFITVIPEIDMPGHTNAALVAYPELDCSGRELELYTGTEVGFSSFCTDKEIVYDFIDDVIRELAELTPGEYLHIGGDESHATEDEDYERFMTRVQKIVQKYGKKSIGWDEVATSDMTEGTIVQYWAGADNAKMGIEKNAKLLMSPANKTYLDMQYDTTSPLGLHWAAYIEADDAYNWDPTEFGEEITKENIIGIEAPLWGETIETLADIEYLTFPRISAIAEIGWAPKENRNWEDYSRRLQNLAVRWDRQGINYYRSKKVWIE